MLRDLPPFESQTDADVAVFMNAPGAEDDSTQISTDYVDPFDDVFGSAPASPSLNAHNDDHGNETEIANSTLPARASDHPSDISRLRSTHVTNGYREGIAASKEQHIQAGFDEGYSLGAEIALKAGYVLGAFEGLSRALPIDTTVSLVITTKQMVHGLARQAQQDLTTEKLLGPEFFGEDGVWTYDVEGEEGEVTFAKVAEAHPIIRKWSENLRALCKECGVDLDQSG